MQRMWKKTPADDSSGTEIEDNGKAECVDMAETVLLEEVLKNNEAAHEGEPAANTVPKYKVKSELQHSMVITANMGRVLKPTTERWAKGDFFTEEVVLPPRKVEGTSAKCLSGALFYNLEKYVFDGRAVREWLAWLATAIAFLVFRVVADGASANKSLMKDLAQLVKSQRDILLILFYYRRCMLHVFGRINERVLDAYMTSAYLYSLAKLFETRTYKKKLRKAVRRWIQADFEWVPFGPVPSDTTTNSEYRDKLKKVLSGGVGSVVEVFDHGEERAASPVERAVSDCYDFFNLRLTGKKGHACHGRGCHRNKQHAMNDGRKKVLAMIDAGSTGYNPQRWGKQKEGKAFWTRLAALHDGANGILSHLEKNTLENSDNEAPPKGGIKKAVEAGADLTQLLNALAGGRLHRGRKNMSKRWSRFEIILSLGLHEHMEDIVGLIFILSDCIATRSSIQDGAKLTGKKKQRYDEAMRRRRELYGDKTVLKIFVEALDKLQISLAEAEVNADHAGPVHLARPFAPDNATEEEILAYGRKGIQIASTQVYLVRLEFQGPPFDPLMRFEDATTPEEDSIAKLVSA